MTEMMRHGTAIKKSTIAAAKAEPLLTWPPPCFAQQQYVFKKKTL